MQVNLYSFAPLCDFLDLKSFLALRSAERATRTLHRISTVNDIVVDDLESFQKLLSLVGPVAEFPVLKANVFTWILPRPRPRIKHLILNSRYFFLDFIERLAEELRWLTLPYVDDESDLYFAVESYRLVLLRRLDICLKDNLKKIHIRSSH